MPIPFELTALDQWVCWLSQPDEPGKKPRKIPINPRTGQPAKSNDPATWTDFDTALSRQERLRYTGLGFMFTKESGLVGVDIDHCYDPQTKTFSDTAKAILAKQPTYAEFSPSGDGIHLWFRGTKPEGGDRNSASGVEMYDSCRYFTVTGETLPDAPFSIAEAEPDTLSWIHRTFIAKPEPERKPAASAPQGKPSDGLNSLSDTMVVARASSAKNGAAFLELYNGRWEGTYPSQSEADLALCCSLAFWTGKNEAQMDRVFRSSGLMRPKWDRVHHADGSTYGQWTIREAVSRTAEVYGEKPAAKPAAESGTGAPPPEGEADTSVFAPTIFEEGNTYVQVTKKGHTTISNFVIRPVLRCFDGTSTTLTADFVGQDDHVRRLSFSTTELSSAAKFRSFLSANAPEFDYPGDDRSAGRLRVYLYRQDWKECRTVDCAGIWLQEDGSPIYVSGDGALTADGPTDRMLQKEEKVSVTGSLLQEEPITTEELKDLAKRLLSYNATETTCSILGWTSACFLKEFLRAKGIRFPHLFLIGEAGSGKSSTLIRVVQPVFSAERVVSCGQITAFTLMTDSASSNMVPLALDEYKPGKIEAARVNALSELFRNAYEGNVSQRGRADQTVARYKPLAPIVVAGEESVDETANRDRSIFLLFSCKEQNGANYYGTAKTDPFTREEAFDWLTLQNPMLRRFGRALLETALRLKPGEAADWHAEGMTVFDDAELRREPRIRSNLAVCYAGLKLVERLCADRNLFWDDLFPECLTACALCMQYAVHEYILEGNGHSRSVVDQAFEIMARMGLSPKEDYDLDRVHGLLYIRLRTVYDRFTRYCRECGLRTEILPYKQFRQQLEHSDLCYDKSTQHRFGALNSRCWAIHYDKLKERCGEEVEGFEESPFPTA